MIPLLFFVNSVSTTYSSMERVSIKLNLNQFPIVINLSISQGYYSHLSNLLIAVLFKPHCR